MPPNCAYTRPGCTGTAGIQCRLSTSASCGAGRRPPSKRSFDGFSETPDMDGAASWSHGTPWLGDGAVAFNMVSVQLDQFLLEYLRANPECRR